MLFALAAEKEVQQPELSMSMFASKEDYQKAVEAQNRACGVRFDSKSSPVKPDAVPLPEPYAWRAVGGSIWGHKTSKDDVPMYDREALFQYGQACAPAASPADMRVYGQGYCRDSDRNNEHHVEMFSAEVPLPEPLAETWDYDRHGEGAAFKTGEYTAEQMSQYAQACAKAARDAAFDECARLAKAASSKIWSFHSREVREASENVCDNLVKAIEAAKKGAT